MPNRITIVVNADGTAAIEGMSQVSGAANTMGQNVKKMGAEHVSVVQQMKTAWIELWAQIQIVQEVISKGREFVELSARAEQSKQTFHDVATSHGYDANSMLEDMKRVSKGMIDDADLSQKALQGMMMGLKPDQITKLLDASRTAARVWGQDVGTTFDTVVTAVGGGVRAMGPLVRMGLITKETFQELNRAIANGADEIKLYDIVAGEMAIQQERMALSILDTYEQLQKQNAALKEIKETAGSVIRSITLGLTSVFAFTGALINDLIAKIMAPFDYLQRGINWVKKELGGGETANMWKNFREQSQGAAQMGYDYAADKMNLALGIGNGAADQRQQDEAKLNALLKERERLLNQLRAAADKGKDTEAVARLEWKKQINMLNPLLDETARKSQELNDIAEKLRVKWGNAAWIDIGLEKGQGYLKLKSLMEETLIIAQGETKEVETRLGLESQLLQYRTQLMEVTEREAIRIKSENDRKILESQMNLLLIQAGQEASDNKRIALAQQYFHLQDQIAGSKRVEVYEYNVLNLKQNEQLAKLEQDRLDMQKQRLDRLFKEMNILASQGGKMSPGLGMMQSGLQGMVNITTGNDEYSQDLLKLQKYTHERMQYIIETTVDQEQQKAAIMDEWRKYDDEQDRILTYQKISYAQNVFQMQAGMMLALFNATGQHHMALFRMYQAFAIANAIVATYSAANKALEQGGGSWYGYVLAAAAIAYGLANVATIASQRPGGSTTGNSGSYSAPSYSESNAYSPPQTDQTTASRAAPVINVNIFGNVVDHDAFARELIPSLKKAFEDGSH